MRHTPHVSAHQPTSSIHVHLSASASSAAATTTRNKECNYFLVNIDYHHDLRMLRVSDEMFDNLSVTN